MSPSSRSKPEEVGRFPTVAAVIPARLASRRFPRKILARETGKYLVQHVYERVLGCQGVERVIVATDSPEVLEACRSFGADVVLTSPDHPSGTDRVAEVARGLEHDIVINVQGDEPLIEHGDLQTLVRLFPSESGAEEGAIPTPGSSRRCPPFAAASRVVMTTLAVRRDDAAGFRDPNIVKVVLSADGNALYFSRAPVPFADEGSGGGVLTWHQHVGIYAYRREFLLGLSALAPTPLEKRERLEQLRVLEHGFSIRVGLSSSRHLGIDTEEEYRGFVSEYLGEKTRS